MKVDTNVMLVKQDTVTRHPIKALSDKCSTQTELASIN